MSFRQFMPGENRELADIQPGRASDVACSTCSAEIELLGQRCGWFEMTFSEAEKERLSTSGANRLLLICLMKDRAHESARATVLAIVEPVRERAQFS